MLITGLTIFLGVALLLVKLPRRVMLRVLKHDLKLDLAVTALVLLIHWGAPICTGCQRTLQALIGRNPIENTIKKRRHMDGVGCYWVVYWWGGEYRTGYALIQHIRWVEWHRTGSRCLRYPQ